MGAPIDGMRRIAAMVLDAELARLHKAAQAREAEQRALAALARPAAALPDLSPVAAGLTVLRYQGWADARRAEINIRLARRQAEWLDARDRAARAFGRAQALDKVAARLAGGPGRGQGRAPANRHGR